MESVNAHTLLISFTSITSKCTSKTCGLLISRRSYSLSFDCTWYSMIPIHSRGNKRLMLLFALQYTCSEPDGLERRRLTCNVRNYAEMTDNWWTHCTDVHARLRNLVYLWFPARSLDIPQYHLPLCFGYWSLHTFGKQVVFSTLP